VLIILEALKIEKIPRAWRVRVWFLTLFAVAALTYLTSPKNGGIVLFQEQLQQFLLKRDVFPVPPPVIFDSLLREAFLTAVGMFFLLLYAVNLIYAPLSEVNADKVFGQEALQAPLYSLDQGRTASGVALRHYPAFLLLALASVSPYLVSIPLLSVPFYVYASMFSMTIFIVIFDHKKIPEAMEASFTMTKGVKFFIFISFMFLRALTSITGDLLQIIFAKSEWTSSLIRAFFFAIRTLASGRLAAMLYRALSIEGFNLSDHSL